MVSLPIALTSRANAAFTHSGGVGSPVQTMGTTIMKQKFFGAAIGLVGLAFAGAFGTPALAQSAMGIERSGNVFHKAACSHAVAPGEAYCHARVVTDSTGNEKEGKNANAAPNVTPSGTSQSPRCA